MDGNDAHQPPTGGPRRRTVLKLGLAGTALLSVGGGLLGWRWLTRGYAAQLSPGDLPLALSVKEFAIVKALVRALLPGEAGFPSGESLAIAQRIDEELWAASPGLRSDLRAGLLLLEHGTLLHGEKRRFTGLERPAQQRYLGKLLIGRSDVMLQVTMALKQLVHVFYYGHPEVWKHIGYDGPYVQRAVPPDSAVAYQQLLRQVGGR